MKIIKKILWALGILLLLILTAAIAGPYLFKDEIVTAVKKGLNKELDADVDFKDVNVSLLRSFPQLSIGLEDFHIQGVDTFAGTDLVHMQEFRLDMNLMSVLKKSNTPEIQEIIINNMDLHLVTLEDGKTNYAIYKGSENNKKQESKEQEIQVLLNRVQIIDSDIKYEDYNANTTLDLQGINSITKATLDGSLASTKNSIKIESADIIQGATAYLSDGRLISELQLDMDMDQMLFTLKENQSFINALELKTDGTIKVGEGYQDYNLNFNCPSDEFRQFLSLLPGAYTKDFGDVQADGKLALNGSVKGRYAETQMPDVNLGLKIQNGSFQYPDLPQDIRQINLNGKIDMTNNLENISVNFPQFSLLLDDNPINGNFILSDVQSDPHLQAALQGKIDLDKLSKAYPVDELKEATGIMDMDIEIDARQSSIENEDYSNVKAEGRISADQLKVHYGSYPPVQLASMRSTLSPRSISVDVAEVSTPNSRGAASAQIDNYLDYVLADAELNVNLKGAFDQIDAGEFMPSDAPEEEPTKEAGALADTAQYEIYDGLNKINVYSDISVNKLLYDRYTIEDLVMEGQFKEDFLDLKNFALKVENSDIQTSGKIQNISGYLFNEDVLTGDLVFRSDNLDINQLMELSGSESDAASSESELSPAPIPKNIDINLTTDINHLKYADYDLSNTRGDVIIRDETLYLDDYKANSLGGNLSFDGSYNTTNINEPKFAMKYSMKEVDFQEVFGTLNSFKVLMPVGKFLEGVLNTEIILEGDLTDKLMPNWGTLDGRGVFETLNGTLKEFGPLQEISDKLKINEIKDIQLENTINWLKIEDGKVNVQEFDFQHEGINFTMGGSHSLNNDMDYKIIARIPKEMMDNNIVGSSVNKGLDFITSEAQKRGLNLESGDSYLVQIDLSGKLTEPQSRFTVLGTEDQDIGNFVEEKSEEIKKQIRDTIQSEIDTLKEEYREQAEEKVEELKDTIQSEIQEKVDTLKKEVKDKVAEEIKDKVGKEAKDKLDEKAEEILGEDAKKEKEKIENAIKEWNPFKKKKKNKKDGN